MAIPAEPVPASIEVKDAPGPTSARTTDAVGATAGAGGMERSSAVVKLGARRASTGAAAPAPTPPGSMESIGPGGKGNVAWVVVTAARAATPAPPLAAPVAPPTARTEEAMSEPAEDAAPSPDPADAVGSAEEEEEDDGR